jgi:5-methyltetrahydropteroyltriglutamate--homocysteine methyltransferase
VVIGPLTYLWLGKAKGGDFDKLDLLERLLPLYGQIFQRLADMGVEWVQIDEPILVLDLPQAWKNAFERLQPDPARPAEKTRGHLLRWPGRKPRPGRQPAGGRSAHRPGARRSSTRPLDRLPAYKVLSLGVVNGRNVWRCDLEKALATLQHAHEKLGDRLWVAPSCSLLHSPVDLGAKTNWMPS